MVDVGAGSGILAIAALRLGAAFAMGIDIDQEALFGAAVENFTLNGFAPMLAVGSADAVKTAAADVTVANINGTVLVYLADDLLRITNPQGKLILTGFPEWELPAFFELFPKRRSFRYERVALLAGLFVVRRFFAGCSFISLMRCSAFSNRCVPASTGAKMSPSR